MIAVTAAVTAAAASIGVAIKGAIDNADKMNKVSQSAGLTVEELSKLKYAADLSDVSMETLGKSLGKLSKAMVAAGSDSASQAGRAFTAMGVAVKNQDGTLRSSSDVLKDIAEKFAGYKDGAEKTSLAIALFGKAGAGMIPLLNQGRIGLEEAGAEAEKFGLVLDKKTTMAAEAFNDNLKRMDAIKQGLFATIARDLLPTFENLSEAMLDAKKSSDFTNTTSEILTGTIRLLVSETLAAVAAFRGFKNEVSALWAFLNAPMGTWGDAWKNYIAVADETRKSLEAVGGTMDRVFAKKPDGDSATFWTMEGIALKGLSREILSYGEAWKKAAPMIGDTTEQKNAVETYLAAQAKRTAGLIAEAQTVGLTADQHARLKVQLEAEAIAKEKNIPLSVALAKSIAAAGDAAAAASIKLQGAQLTQEMLAPWDLRNQKLQQYNALLQQGAISQDTFSAAALRLKFPAFTQAAQAAVDFGQRLGELGTNAIGSLSNALSAVIMGTKDAATAFKEFTVQIIADLIAMVIKAVIFKAIMMAIGFSGGGAVSSEATALVSGITPMAGGGAVMGPGTSTSDSIPAMLSNGEFVVNAQASRQWMPVLNAINSGSMPRFADGGQVGDEPQAVRPASAVSSTCSCAACPSRARR